MLKTKAKIIAICIIGLMICGSTGILAANTQKVITTIDNQNTLVKQQPLSDKGGVLLSYINVKANQNKLTKTGGYSLFYLLITQGKHDVAWNVDYTVWHTSGTHDHGAQNGVGKTITIGNYQISFGRANNKWQEYTYGSYKANLLSDGNEEDNDSDQNNGYNGEFGVDAGADYNGTVGETIQFTGTVIGGSEPYAWSWNFGDGNTSTEQNPIHVYNVAGQYEVILTVTDSGTTDPQEADDSAMIIIS
jgi:PKD repeat protein